MLFRHRVALRVAWTPATGTASRDPTPPFEVALATGANAWAIVQGGGWAGKGDAVLENVRDDNYALQVIVGLQLNGVHAPTRPSAPPETRAFARKSWALKSVTLLQALQFIAVFAPSRAVPVTGCNKNISCRINYLALEHNLSLDFYFVYDSL